MGKISIEKYKDDFDKVKKAIYDFCLSERIRYTFKAKDIARLTGFTKTKVGRHLLPLFLERGLIKIFSEGNHATRYVVVNNKWKDVSY